MSGTGSYTRLFDPDRDKPTVVSGDGASFADRAPPSTYDFDDSGLVLAINLALATGRPLLVRGPSGVGKSAMARAVADRLKWSFLSHTITSRTLARDILYEVDELRRLRDANAGNDLSDWRRYIVPGPLFWAFAPALALSLMAQTGREKSVPVGIQTRAANTVVLLDEIDKADPDVPNNLLEPLGNLSFSVPGLIPPLVAAKQPPLLVLTTNEERDLPDAFLRRCIEYTLQMPTPARLRTIALLHDPTADAAQHEMIATLGPQSVAEYLDAVRACKNLKPEDAETVRRIAGAVLNVSPRERR